jgi:rhodanese-related sulfurtransferase
MIVTTNTAARLVSEAKARIESLSPAAIAAELEAGNVFLVDVREPEERQQLGVIPGAIHAPRGMIEFYADPTSAYHHPEFDPERRTVLHCATGGRSALAVDALQGLGYRRVAHLEGGFRAWQEAGLAVERSP